MFKHQGELTDGFMAVRDKLVYERAVGRAASDRVVRESHERIPRTVLPECYPGRGRVFGPSLRVSEAAKRNEFSTSVQARSKFSIPHACISEPDENTYVYGRPRVVGLSTPTTAQVSFQISSILLAGSSANM